MSHSRDITYLIKNRIIYKRDPITDKPTVVYPWGSYYEEGTYQCYSLFNSKAKINTYKSLKWHLYVLWYLNPQLDQDDFESLVDFIVDKSNGFVTFTVPKLTLENIIYEVSMQDLDRPPKNKLRKIIFKDNSGLTVSEKLSIVGRIIGRKKIGDVEIYDAMIMLHDDNNKITVSKLAALLYCSTRTIHRNMSNELKKEKELLNRQLNEKV